MPTGMTFTDISSVLNELNYLATGQESTTEIVDTSTFVTVAEATLRTGYDNFTNAVSQVLTRDIFSVRPYEASMPRLQVSGEEWGNHVRKHNYFDKPAVTDASWTLTDGQSVDMYTVNKPKTLQTNYYGQTNYSRVVTQPMVQMNSAFTGPEGFAEWWSGLVLHMSNQIEQDRENLAYGLISNFLGALPTTNPGSVIYLLDEYNALMGLSGGEVLTTTTVYLPENFPGFAKYAFGRINDISDMLRRRSINWHQNWNITETDYNFMRHTPYDRQHLYLYSATQRHIDASVLADTFNQGQLAYRDYELVPFWQNIDDRDSLSVTPILTTSAGVSQKATQNTKLTNIFGCIFDWDAIGYSPIDNKVLATPVNARGQYTNFWYHYNWRWYNDFTENAVLFLMTSADVTHPAGDTRSASTLSSTRTVEDGSGGVKTENVAMDEATITKAARTAKK